MKPASKSGLDIAPNPKLSPRFHESTRSRLFHLSMSSGAGRRERRMENILACCAGLDVHKACASYCTLSRFDSGRFTAATPFDNRDTPKWLIERIAAGIAIDTPQQTGPRPPMQGRFGDY